MSDFAIIDCWQGPDSIVQKEGQRRLHLGNFCVWLLEDSNILGMCWPLGSICFGIPFASKILEPRNGRALLGVVSSYTEYLSFSPMRQDDISVFTPPSKSIRRILKLAVSHAVSSLIYRRPLIALEHSMYHQGTSLPFGTKIRQH